MKYLKKKLQIKPRLAKIRGAYILENLTAYFYPKT